MKRAIHIDLSPSFVADLMTDEQIKGGVSPDMLTDAEQKLGLLGTAIEEIVTAVLGDIHHGLEFAFIRKTRQVTLIVNTAEDVPNTLIEDVALKIGIKALEILGDSNVRRTYLDPVK